VVSSVASCLANVSYAICSVRMCSRESLVGRRKSYGTGPVLLARRFILPDARELPATEDDDWVTPHQSAGWLTA
jgi:hypothetical protein